MFEDFSHALQGSHPGESKNPYSAMTQGTKRELFDRFEKMFHDPREFFKAIRTKDEADTENPIKAFPIHKEYIQILLDIMQNHPLVDIAKSRRMLASWTVVGGFGWSSCFRKLQHNAFVSKKEADSDKLVKRIDFIFENLDKDLFPKEMRPELDSKFCRTSFGNSKSIIEGFPSGADQLRQHGFTRMLWDEIAFWDNPEQTYKGSIYTLQSGAKESKAQLIMLSSKAPGWFKRHVFDKLDHTREDFSHEEAIAEIKPFSPMEGMQIWKNKKNTALVVSLNYRADPEKRKPEWIAREKAKSSKKDWNQEMEDAWESYEGVPVWDGEWNPSFHSKTDLDAHIGLPLLRGWDFGLTPACIVAQLQGTRLVVLKEFQEFNLGTDKFSDLVLPLCNTLWPGFKWVDFIDPAGQDRDQSEEGQSALVLDSKGLSCIAGEVTWTKRKKAVSDLMKRIEPSTGICDFAVNPLECPTLIRGFNGGYRYNDRVIDIEPNKVKPLKDEHSHGQDALQYLCSGIIMVKGKGRSHRKLRNVSYRSNNRTGITKRVLANG